VTFADVDPMLGCGYRNWRRGGRVTRFQGRRKVSFLIIAAFLVAACDPAGLINVAGRSAECAGHPQPDMCEQALAAVVAELGDRREGGQIRIDPVQCAHGRCWTWAYVTGARGGADQQLSVDWLADGEITVGYVVP
jgi:hypothetical protein